MARKMTHAQVLRRMRKHLRQQIKAEMTRLGLVVEHHHTVIYGQLRAPLAWQFDYGNLTVHSDYAGARWLTGRASTSDVNAEEPVYVGIHMDRLLGRR